MNGPTQERRTAEDLEWNVALAGLIQAIEQAKGAVNRADLAMQRVRIAGQCQRESEPRLIPGLSPSERVRTVIVSLRYAIHWSGLVPVNVLGRYLDDLERAIDDLVSEQAADHAR